MSLTERQKKRKEYLESAIDAIHLSQTKTLCSGSVSMEFNGRSIQRISPASLEKIRRSFETELTKLERIESGEKVTRTVRVRV